MANKPKAKPEAEPTPEEVMLQPGQVFMPPLELVVHGGALQVDKVPTPEGTITISRFLTPMLAITTRFDDASLEHYIGQLRGNGIVVPPTGLVLPR